MKFSLIKALIFSIFLLIFFSLLNIITGPYPVLKGVISRDPISYEIILELRLPPLILALSCGVLLSLSGAIFQSILSNPLSDPYILGVSGGAASFILLSNLLKIPQQFPYTFIFSFFGAVFNAFLVYFLSIKEGKIKTINLILTGIILNGFYSAFILFSMALLENLELNRFIFWMMGNFYERTLKESIFLLILTILFIIPPLIFHRGFDLITLGQETASSSGLPSKNFLIFSYLNASLLSGLSVSFVGVIGFVGLIIPNLIRILFSSKHNILLPLSIFSGAIFLIISDTITRFKFLQNVPVGAISAMIGVPFFIYILKRNGNN